ncbi:MAG: hypothetical protein ACSW8K_03270 [bacterium]
MQYEEDCFVLICDRDLRYARHLQEYLLSEGGLSCSVRILTDPGQLEKGGGKDKAMFLILSESLQGSWMETMEPDSILILSESGAFPENGPACVSKYQAARCLVEALLRLPGAGSLQTGASIRHGSPLEMIGFYTPVSRALQTSLALTMGQLLSEEGPALYLNLEPCSGLDTLLGLIGENSLTDLIYYNDCAPEKFPALLGAMAQEVNGLFCLPPPRSSMELAALREEQWTGLFRSIDRVTDYRYLILDLSARGDCLLDTLRLCDRIYTIEREDPVSSARLLCYEDQLRRFHYEDIGAKTRRLRLPIFRELPSSMKFLTHGPLADYTRELIREGRKT